MGDTQYGIEWPQGLVLAQNVIVAHSDLASAGIRAGMLLSRNLRALTKTASGVSSPKLCDFDEEGNRKEVLPAWTDQKVSTESALEVETFMDTDSKPVLTFILVNAPLTLENTTTVANYVVSRIVAAQVSNVTLLAAARFAPKTAADAPYVHTVGFKSGAVQTISQNEQLRPWDPSWTVEDGFLAAMMQLLKLESAITTECLIAVGYRLPRAIQVNLPGAAEDSTTLDAVIKLYGAVQLGIASEPIQAAAAQQALPACDVAGIQGRFQPARPLTEGEFAVPEPDSSSSLYK